MCERCDREEHLAAAEALTRRSTVKAMGAAALALSLGSTAAAATGRGAARGDVGAAATSALGTLGAGSAIVPTTVVRRAAAADDVVIEVLYCGVCHSDVHIARGEVGRPDYPIVPGHEVVGRVIGLGGDVRRFEIGDIVGVGTMVDSCGTCTYCRIGLEQYCANGNTQAYGVNRAGQKTFGGFSKRMVVRDHFVFKIPDVLDPAAAGPLMCAGITTYSPLEKLKVAAGQKVAIVGLGGLGHLAVKLAVARGCPVTVVTTSAGKLPDARRLGAERSVLWTDTEALAQMRGRFDVILATVPASYDINPFLMLLAVDGTIVNLGVLGKMDGGGQNIFLLAGRRSITSSAAGGVPETQALLDYSASRRIVPEVTVIPAARINEAFGRIVAKDVKFRFVLDMKTLA